MTRLRVSPYRANGRHDLCNDANYGLRILPGALERYIWLSSRAARVDTA
jgi:hypothetical protein